MTIRISMSNPNVVTRSQRRPSKTDRSKNAPGGAKWTCAICDLVMINTVKDSHLAGKKHAQRVAESQANTLADK